MKNNSKILILGSSGMVGSSFVRIFKKKNYKRILSPKRNQLNLLNFSKVKNYISKNKPDIVIIAAAKVGGINANNLNKVNFLYENLEIQNNIIYSCHLLNIKELLFLGSSCVYPKYAKQPIEEKSLLTGALETTNEAYSLAKISGIKLCEYIKNEYKNRNYISVMPSNLYGPNDNYDLKNSHVLPALMKKIYNAKNSKLKQIVLWGSGKPKREFLYVDDLVEACIFILKKKYNGSLINIGTGEETSIKKLAIKIMEIMDINLKIKYDASFPDGTPRKVLNVDKIFKLGWKPKVSLQKGIKKIYEEKFKKNKK